MSVVSGHKRKAKYARRRKEGSNLWLVVTQLEPDWSSLALFIFPFLVKSKLYRLASGIQSPIHSFIWDICMWKKRKSESVLTMIWDFK